MSETATAEAPAPVKVEKSTSRELAVMHQGNASVPMPANFEQMERFAQLMARGTNMVGPAFRDNPGACLGALIQAMRWGMDPYSCSQKMYIASKTGEGPIAYEAQLIHAVILKNAPLTKRPRCTYSGEGPELRCHVVFHVIGEDEPLTYDSPPLKKVKKNSPLWVDDPEQQLWYYSVRAGARRHFPDVIMGVYAPDEVESIGQTQAIEGEVVTLGGGAVNAASEGEKPVEAEFSDGTAALKKNAAKKKAGQKPAKAEGNAGGETPAAVTAAEPKPGDRPTESPEGATGATAGAESSAQGPDPDNEPDEDESEDIALVADLESRIDPAKAMSSRKAVNEHRGALARIAEHGSDELKARAAKILADWPVKA